MQQYISGERIDRLFGVVGYMGSFISMATGYVTPWLQRRTGIYEGNGGVDPVSGQPAPWWVLKNRESYDRLAKTMILSSVVGATMNVIPLFFYNLTEQKQRAVVKCLKIRAMFEDYDNGIYDKDKIAEALEIIKNLEKDKENAKNKECRKLRDILKEDDRYEVDIVIDELHKFEKPDMIVAIERAEKIAENGYDAIYNFNDELLKNAKKLPAKTKGEKKYRRDEIRYYKELRSAQSDMRRFYPDGKIIEPDYARLDELYNTVATDRKQAKAIRKKIQALEAEKSAFFHATLPYYKAQKLLREEENYSHLDDIIEIHGKTIAE